MVEAFATVREASDRVLGMKHYPVQLLGGIVLHNGQIAEMKTGEGKTLVETLPAYLNALDGKGVHIVTVNDYLAKRDQEWMGKVYSFLGLTVGCIIYGLTNSERQKNYNCDITYGTNNQFGFDYLRDNMVIYRDNMVQRGLHYAIVDEVDSILIDEARTPLIIAGEGDEDSKLYELANSFIKTIKEEDYELDRKDCQQEFFSFTKNFLIEEVSNDETESCLEKNWSEKLDIDRIFNKIKNKYDMLYKSTNVEKTKIKQNIIILILIVIMLTILYALF